MNFSGPYIARPVATTLVMTAIVLLGGLAYRLLPLSALPVVEYPTIQVSTFYPGASAEVMTSAVTAPLEKQLGQMAGLTQMSSHSSAGASVVTLQFDLALSLDVAEQEVQAAINAATSFLPADLPAPPIYAKVNPADIPILTIGITSKTLPLTEVEDLIDIRLAQKIAQVRGVGLITIQGGQRPSVRIRFNSRALAAFGLNIDDLRTGIANLNVNAPKGLLEGPNQTYTVDANDQLIDVDAYAESIIAYRNGRAVRLSDVATVVSGPENTHLGAWINRTPALILTVQRQPGANVIHVVDGIRAVLPALQATLPAAVTATILTDRTTTIRASLRDVAVELAISVALVVLVIFLFLRNPAATLIPSLSVPLSLIGALAGMYLWGFSLDTLSLMALTIASGFVVDDAIVVIENISRHIEAGRSPMQAALDGSREIGFTIISLTVSLLAVLIPLLFMADVVGRVFHELALTLAIAIVLSAFVSLTLVPMMCARLLRQRTAPGVRPGALAHGWARRRLQSLVAAYGRLLDALLGHRTAMLLVVMGTMGLTAVLALLIPKGFFPIQDTGLIQAITQAPQSTSYAAMIVRQQALVEVVLRDPEIDSVASFLGIDGMNASLNAGRLLIKLRPRASRRSSAAAISRRLQLETAQLVGITATMQPVQDLTIDSGVSAGQYRFILVNPNGDDLAAWSAKLAARLQKDQALRDVASDVGNNSLAVELLIDRATAGRYGITAAMIDDALYDAFGQRIVSTIFTQSNQYRVIMEAAPAVQSGLSALNGIYLPSLASGTAAQVPLSALVHVNKRSAPAQIGHWGQFPAATLSFNLADGASLGDAMAAVRKAERGIVLPDSFQTVFEGALSAFEASRSNEFYLVLASVVTMYIVLGVLYESFIHPLTILSTLPSASVGALLALDISHGELDVIGIIGIVLLIGLVKKNAIMIVDFALAAERTDGLSPRAAIHRASVLRFRPILMTTLAALFAALPLMLGGGNGSELRQPLGIVIVGGLVASQLLTLFSTPVVYLAFDGLAQWIKARRRRLQTGEAMP
jgi:multidrug efflux pump